MTDTDFQRRRVASEFRCKWFDTPEQMITSGAVDAVVIATPHWQHAEWCISGLSAGLHVICEKPLAVTVSQADEVLRVAKNCKGTFAVVHQSRFEPCYREVKRLLESGELGSMLRCSMIETVWRSQAYYKSSPWRGTWKGEGGGVLLNQAPHLLDRYVWLCGMPERLSAHCNATMHQIEVEDSASSVLQHKGGAHGHIHVSTNECPSVVQTTIACDKGRIVLDHGVARVTRLCRSIREATISDRRYWGEIAGETQELGGGLSSIPALLAEFYKNFALATVGETKLMCPADEGRNAVELANAATLSSSLGHEVALPLVRSHYENFINGKLVES